MGNPTAFTPESLLQKSIELVSLPDIFLQVNSMLDDPRYLAADIGDVICKDPALSARLLKIANSALYGLRGRVDTLSRALTFVGTKEVRDMLLATSVVDLFSGIPQNLVDMTDFWIRSVQCGILARLLAKECSVLHSERFFIAGLLHDLGSMVMYLHEPELAREVLVAANGDRWQIPGLEKKLFGFTFADVGAALIKHWQLSEPLQAMIASQLDPLQAPSDYRLDSHLLHLASRLCAVSIDGYALAETLADVPEETLIITRLDEATILTVMNRLPEEFASVFDLIVPSVRLTY